MLSLALAPTMSSSVITGNHAMAKHMTPSTLWQETVASDEAQRYARYSEQFAALQARKSKKYGNGRALHRKQLTAAKGSLEVLKNLPDFARQGLFAKPGTFETWVRLSNGGMDKASDHKPDIRGFSLRVLGVSGDSALGNGPAVSQDFALINQEVFGFSSADDFVQFVVAASQGGGALLKHLFKRYGMFGAPLRLLGLLKTMGKSFSGFATETVFSAAPFACGPYAVRVRLVPAAGNGPVSANAKQDWNADFSAKLREKKLQWELQLQPFLDAERTPIEDASVNWTSPYTTVARLTLPQQDCDSAAGKVLAEQVESSIFDPWQALAAHRPLGDVMRARKAVYFVSQQARGAA